MDFLELPKNNSGIVDSSEEKGMGLTAILSKPLTKEQILNNPYAVIPLNKIEGVGRYLNSSTYNKLGFSFDPDLDTKYYKETPWYEQVGNATGQFIGQAGAAFDAQMSKLEQIKQTFGTTDGDYLEDAFKASEDLREKYPIFKSSNETYGLLGYIPFVGDSFSKWTNFVPNLGFTVGTMAGVFLENAVATAIIEGTTGGTATPLLPAKWLKGLYEGVKGVKDFYNFKKMASFAKLGEGIYETEKVLGTAGNIFRGVEALKAGKSLNGALHSLYGGYQLYSSAAAEAMIENANSVGELMKDFKNSFIEENSRDPNGAELAKMQEAAEGLILPSSLGNIGILMASNGLQEMNAFKAGKALSTLAVTGSKKLATEASRRMILDQSTGLYREALANELTKSTIKSLGRGALNVFSEGLEESAQGVVAESTKNYFKAKYYNKPISWTDALGQGFAYATSDQGMEEFYAGIVTGGIFSGGGKALNQYQLKRDLKKSFEKTGKNFDELVKDDIKDLNESVVSLIKFNMASSQSSENLKVQTVIQQKIRDAENKDIADIYKAQSLFKAMFTAKAYGKDEELLKHYKSLNQLERADLAKYLQVNESELSTPEEFENTLKDLEAASEVVDVIAKKYANPYKKPTITDPKYSKLKSEELEKQFLMDTALFEGWQGTQELLAGQIFLANKSRGKYQDTKLKLESTNIPLDLLAAITSKHDRPYINALNLTMDLMSVDNEINELRKKGEIRKIKQLQELRSSIKEKRDNQLERADRQTNAQVNYLTEIQKRVKEHRDILSLIEDKKEKQRLRKEIKKLISQYSIIANNRYTQEDKIEELNKLQDENQKFLYTPDFPISDIIEGFNTLGQLKQDIDFSENTINILSSPNRFTSATLRAYESIFENRKALFENIVEGKTEEEEKPITSTEPITPEQPITPEPIENEEKLILKPGTIISYKDKDYTIKSIKFKDGESIYTLEDSEGNTLETTDSQEFKSVVAEKPVKEEELKSTEEESAETPTSEKEAQKADIEKRTTKVISSETVEKGRRKGQTRTVTQTNYTENIEGTVISVTEYDAKIGDTTVTAGGRTMTLKEFKEEFPLTEDYAEILKGFPDIDDNTKITVRTVRRAPTKSRFGSVVDIFNPTTLGKMRVEIKKDDAKYDAELADLETQFENKEKTYIEKLKSVKELINNSKNINSDMDNIFKVINKDSYKEWQNNFDQEILNEELKEPLSKAKSKEKTYEILNKYLLNKYIESELNKLGESTLQKQQEEDAVKAEVGTSESLNTEDVLNSLNPIDESTTDEPLVSKEDYLNKLVEKLQKASELGKKARLNKEEKEFYKNNKEEIEAKLNKELNKEPEEKNVKSFLKLFNNLLLIDIPEKNNSIYQILQKIKYSISNEWFKFKSEKVSINLNSKLKSKAKLFENVEVDNRPTTFIDASGNKQVKNYYNIIFNNNIKEAYDNFELFQHQLSLHLDFNESNTDEILDKLLKFANENDVYILIGSAYNIARPDNIRIYSKSKISDLELTKDLKNIQLTNGSDPLIGDIKYDKLPSTDELVDFIDSVDEDIKEQILNYLKLFPKDREFLTNGNKDYKNGLSLLSLEAVEIMSNAYSEFKETGEINAEKIVKPVLNLQIKKAAFYGEVNSLLNELLNNSQFDNIRKESYFQKLISKASNKLKDLSVFNFGGTQLKIGDKLYDKNNTYSIVDLTLESFKNGESKVLVIRDDKTGKQTKINALDFRTNYSTSPILGPIDPKEVEQQLEEEFQALPSTILSTISNDTDIFITKESGLRERIETPDKNSVVGRLVLQRLANEDPNITLKVEVPGYDDENSPFYITPGSNNPNVPQRIQEFIIEKLDGKKFGELTPDELNDVKQFFGKIVTIFNKDTNDYERFNDAGFPNKKGIIPLYFLPSGTLSITDSTISYGGRELMPISDLMKKGERTYEEVVNQAKAEAKKLDEIRSSDKPMFIKAEGVSKGVIDKEDTIQYSEIKEEPIKFEFDNDGKLLLKLNNTSLTMRQKPIGEGLAIAMLSYLGVEPGFLLAKGYKQGSEIKSRFKTLQEKVNKSKDKEESYKLRKEYIDLLNNLVFTGTKGINAIFGEENVFDFITLVDYSSKEEQKPNLIFRLQKTEDESNQDFYDYLNRLVNILSKVSVDTSPAFLKKKVNDNFVVENDTVDIKKVPIAEFIFNHYIANGIYINKSLLNSKNRYILLGEVSEEKSRLVKKSTIKRINKEDRLFINKDIQIEDSDSNLTQEIIGNEFKQVRDLIPDISPDRLNKFKKDITQAKTLQDLNKLKMELAEEFNCKLP